MKQQLRDGLFFLPAPFLAAYGNSRPFWYDEVHSIYYAHLGLRQMVETLKQDVHSPTYFLLLKGWLAIVGEHEFAVRLLSSVFYLLSIFAVYRCARSVCDNKTALLAGILVMASPLAVMHAHLGRLYSLLCLLSALSLWLLLEIFQKRRDSRMLYFLFVLVNASGCLVHLWFFFFLLAEFICLIVLYDKRVLTILLFSLAPFPFLVLWLPFFRVQLSNRPTGMPWLTAPGIPEVGYTAFLFGAGVWIVAVVATLLGKRWERRFRLGPSFTFFSIFALTLAIPFVLSQYRPVYFVRYTVVALPAFTIWMATFLLRGISFRSALLSSCIFVLAPTIFLEVSWLRNGGDGCNDKWMATFLSEHSTPTDRIVYAGVHRLPIQYYINKLPNRPAGTSLPSGIDTHVAYLNRFTSPSDPPDVSREATQLEMSLNSPVWVVYGHLKVVNDEVDRIFQRRFRPVWSRECDCKTSFDYNYVSFSRVVRYELNE